MFNLPILNLSKEICAIFAYSLLCIFLHNQTVVSITICCPEQLDTKYTHMHLPIYQNIGNLIVHFPIWRHAITLKLWFIVPRSIIQFSIPEWILFKRWSLHNQLPHIHFPGPRWRKLWIKVPLFCLSIAMWEHCILTVRFRANFHS
jgi:hypothetical protein